MKKTNDSGNGFACCLLFFAICILLPIALLLCFAMPPVGLLAFGGVIYLVGAAIQGFAESSGRTMKQSTSWIIAVCSILFLFVLFVVWVIVN